MRTMCMCTGCFTLRWAAAEVTAVFHDTYNGATVKDFGYAIRLMDRAPRPIARDFADSFWNAQAYLDKMLMEKGYMVNWNTKGDR